MNMLLTAIGGLVDRLFRIQTSRIRTIRRDDGVWVGYVRLGREWFEFVVTTLTTHTGAKLVTSFYVGVGGKAAVALREYRRDSTNPTLPEDFPGRFDRLPFRAFADEGDPDDLDGSLRAAIKAFRSQLRRSSALALRRERISIDSPLHVMPAEVAADVYNHPGYDGSERLHVFLARQDAEDKRRDDELKSHLEAQDRGGDPVDGDQASPLIVHAALLYESDVTVQGDATGNDMTWLLDGVQVAHGRFTRAAACVEFASGERYHGAEARWLATLGDIVEMSDSEPEPALES